MWILKLPIGSKHIVMCPKDCQNNKKAKVFGTGNHNSLSRHL